MTPRKLTSAERLENIRHAAEQLKNYAGHRDLLIEAAHESGVSMRQIAEAAGLSHQRVHQILHGR